jgi:hypothetical protein
MDYTRKDSIIAKDRGSLRTGYQAGLRACIDD